MIGELARKVRKASGNVMFCAHYLTPEFQTIPRIHRGLAREAGSVRAHHAGAHDATLSSSVLQTRTRSEASKTSGRDIFMLGELRLATNARICGVVDGLARAPDNGVPAGRILLSGEAGNGSNRPMVRLSRGQEALVAAAAGARVRSDVDLQNTSPFGADWRHAGNQHQLIIGRKLHDLARRRATVAPFPAAKP